MPKGKNKANRNKMKVNQIIFAVISLIIVVSFILSLFINT